MTRPKGCRKRHLYRGKMHAAGCDTALECHWHVACRRCGFWWLQLTLFPVEAVA
jgi:hypothetical protein